MSTKGANGEAVNQLGPVVLHCRQAQRIVAVPSNPALIYLSGPRADVMLVETSGQEQADGLVAVPSDLSAGPAAVSGAQESALGSNDVVTHVDQAVLDQLFAQTTGDYPDALFDDAASDMIE